MKYFCEKSVNLEGKEIKMELLIVKADAVAVFDDYCGKYLKYISPERQARVERMRSEISVNSVLLTAVTKLSGPSMEP